jgi:23S rRNA maturation mini-RNase III
MSKVVQVRDVPEEVHETLSRQAEGAGMSLNRFLLAEFESIARRSRNAEVLSRARERAGPRLATDDIVADVRAERDRLG